MDKRIQLGAQIGMLNRRMYKEYGVKLKDLEVLKNIYIVYIDKKALISKISETQSELIEKLGIVMEVY